MKAIYKYLIEETNLTKIDVPWNSQFLSIKLQGGLPVAYFSVVKEEPTDEVHTFLGVMTGREAPDASQFKYVDTFMYNDGEFVVHYFKKI